MFSAKSPAKQYHAHAARLNTVEAAFRQAVEALQSALEQRRAADVPGLRKKAAAAEGELRQALAAAHASWAGYWHHRAEIMAPELHHAATVIRRHDAIRSVVGNTVVSPAMAIIQSQPASTPPDLIDADAVPTDAPDSDALEDFKGCWR